jgi:uncharacterized membrane protein YkoI
MPPGMKMRVRPALSAVALLLAGPSIAEAHGQRRSDQMRAYDARRGGRMLSQQEIERRVVPAMGDAQYLGLELDDAGEVYTLKFVRNGMVIWVRVDGRSGKILPRQ